MNRVKFPALVGESPLAILAAIGTLRLIHDFVDGDARLSWDPDDRAPVLHSRLASVDAVVEELTSIVLGMPKDVVVPGGPSTFPLERIGTKGPDPMRPAPGGMANLFETLAAGSCKSEIDTVAVWIGSLVTDLAFKDSKSKKDEPKVSRVSQFISSAGQQTIATMLRKSHDSVRSHPEYLHQALVGWRRVPGVTGEYLDHRARWDSGEDGRGKAEMRGVPGATWLALMSYPLWMTTANGKRPRTSGWHSEPGGGSLAEELRLPLWLEPLGPAAIIALIEHPELDRAWADMDQRWLHLTGVISVCRARRRKAHGEKAAGVLVPIS